MESLTNELVEAALEIITEVESFGGMAAYTESGMAKYRIEESATKKQGRIDSGQDIIVGVNKYALAEDDVEDIDVLSIDNTKVRERQTARLNETKAARDATAATSALNALRASAALTEITGPGTHPNNLLALAVTAARARCTVGEISDALETSFGRHVPKVR